MKNKFLALFLSAVLCVTATPVTGMAAEFTNDTAAAETSEKDMNEESEEIPGQVEKHIIVPGEVPKLLKSESDTGSKTDIQYTIY